MKVYKKPIGLACVKGKAHCRGFMSRINLSRLEEGLGHEGFQCTECGAKAKYVPGVVQ